MCFFRVPGFRPFPWLLVQDGTGQSIAVGLLEGLRFRRVFFDFPSSLSSPFSRSSWDLAREKAVLAGLLFWDRCGGAVRLELEVEAV